MGKSNTYRSALIMQKKGIKTCTLKTMKGEVCGAPETESHYREYHQNEGKIKYSDKEVLLTRGEDGCTCLSIS